MKVKVLKAFGDVLVCSLQAAVALCFCGLPRILKLLCATLGLNTQMHALIYTLCSSRTADLQQRLGRLEDRGCVLLARSAEHSKRERERRVLM